MGIFNHDGPFFAVLSKVCDLIFLSVIWVLLCIPIITIGPATTAMYYATVKVIRRERGYLFREFFKSFRLNFKKGVVVGLITTILYGILLFDLYVTWTSMANSGKMSSVLLGTYFAILLLLTCFSIYAYPVLSRFELTLKQLFKTSFFMSMRHILHTIGMLAIMALSVIGVVFNFMLIFIIPAGATFLISMLMERLLKKYTPKSENTDDETAKDEWYLE